MQVPAVPSRPSREPESPLVDGSFPSLRDTTVSLPAFSGPLALLIRLIRQNEVDIYDIPIALITEQYLAEVERMEYQDLQTAGDFLLMGATLLEIKSSAMLPPSPVCGGEEPVDPRAELVQHLLEYQAFQAIADEIGLLERVRRLISPRPFTPPDLPIFAPPPPPNLHLDALQRALQRMLQRLDEQEPITSIPGQLISLRLRMREIAALAALSGKRGLSLEEALRPDQGRHFLIVSFLAVLELLKAGRIRAEETAGDVRLFSGVRTSAPLNGESDD